MNEIRKALDLIKRAQEVIDIKTKKPRPNILLRFYVRDQVVEGILVNPPTLKQIDWNKKIQILDSSNNIRTFDGWMFKPSEIEIKIPDRDWITLKEYLIEWYAKGYQID